MNIDNPCVANGGDCEGSFWEIFEPIELVAKKLKQIQRLTIKDANLTPPSTSFLRFYGKKIDAH